MALRRWAIGLAWLGIWAVAAGGAEYFVDAAAETGGDGSKGSPWNDAQAAVDRLKPGDVLTVRGSAGGGPRVYPNLLVSPASAAGTKDNRITVRALPGENVEFRRSGRGAVLMVAQPYWTFEGMVFDGGGGGGDCVKLRSSFAVIRNCEVRRCGGDGIDVENKHGDQNPEGDTDRPEGNLLEHLTIHDCINRGDAHGIVVGKSDRLTVRYCYIYNCSGDSIQVAPNDRRGHVFERNYFRITPDYKGRYENGVDLKPCKDVTIRENLFEGFLNSQGAIRIGPGSGGAQIEDVRIEGNTFLNCTRGIRGWGRDEEYPRRIVVARNLFVFDLAGEERNRRMDYAVSIGASHPGARGYVVVGNTIVNARAGWPMPPPRRDGSVPDPDLRDLVYRNNLHHRVDAPHPGPGESKAAIDHNGYFASPVPGDAASAVKGEDPMFADPARRNFALRGGSPAIDAGAKDPGDRAPITGKAPDVGCVEVGKTHPAVDPKECGWKRK